MRLKKILLIVFIASCGSNSIEEIPETTTTTLDPELSICERVEKEYISLSNQLFETSFELNDYINNLSDALVEKDRDIFFKDLDKNVTHQDIYKKYLETRAFVYEQINILYTNNSECPIAGDQEISDEKVLESKKELSDFLSRY